MIALFVAVFSVFAVITCATISSAHADEIPISAGDTITHGSRKCTIGYVYRVWRHTMALSAGHCADLDVVDDPVTDTDAGVHGRSVSITYIPSAADSGAPLKDWWLIDFGDVAWSDRIAGTNYRVLSYTNAHVADEVCYFGAASAKEICGLVTDVNNPMFTVTQTGRHGDSGGPTYLKINDTAVTMVGLWQGHSDSLGYVISLPAALNYLRARAA